MISLVMAMLFPVTAYGGEQEAVQTIESFDYQTIAKISDGEYELENKVFTDGKVVSTKIKVRTESTELEQLLDDAVKENESKSSGGTMTLWTKEWDPTNTFSAKLTITAVKDGSTGIYPYWSFDSASILITGATGTSGAYVGNNITLTGQTLYTFCDGWNEYGHKTYTDSTYKTPTVRSWSYTPPGTWHHVYAANPDLLSMGGNLYVTYKVGTNATINTLTVNTQVF